MSDHLVSNYPMGTPNVRLDSAPESATGNAANRSIHRPPSQISVFLQPFNASPDAKSTYHAHQLPHGITGLRTHTQPVLCACPIKRDLLVWACLLLLIVESHLALGNGVVGTDDLEGLGAASRARNSVSTDCQSEVCQLTTRQQIDRLVMPVDDGGLMNVMPTECREREISHVPSLCHNDVVKGVVLVAKARQSDSDNHCVCCEVAVAINGI